MPFLLNFADITFLSVSRISRTAFKELGRDLKATRWLRGLGWSFGVIWFFGLLGSLITFAALQIVGSEDTACQPDGSFRLHPETYSSWSSTGFFQITLGGGHLTFAKAKLVDIVWDIGVGRGGQLLMALVSWREFGRYLTICMETQPVTYQLFRTIFIENDASVLSTYRTIRSFIWQRRLRSNTAMIFMTATMIFILAFPTLISAMSGYDLNVASRIQDSENNLVPFNKYSRVLYVIHDGWRIEQDGNYWITDNTTQADPVLRTSMCEGYDGPQSAISYSYRDTTCLLIKSVSEYVKAHGLNGLRNDSSLFHDQASLKNFTLSAPVLNISAYYTDDKRMGGANSSGVLNTTWVRTSTNDTIDEKYINGHGTCQSTGDYKWGFSFLQLYICVLLLFAWTVGIYSMWIHTHFTMALRNRHAHEISGENRAVLELAAAMQIELDIHEYHPSALKEKELKERIKKDIRGGTISSAYLGDALESHSVWKSLVVWFKRDKWWFMGMFVISAVSVSIWMFIDQWAEIWLWSVWFGMFWAFCIGTTVGSRLLIILFWGIKGGLTIGMIMCIY